MRICEVNPCGDPLWRELVESRQSSVFHSPAWIQSVTATYDFDPCALVLLDADGRPQAGLPFCTITDMKGTRIASLPFSDYCDPLVSNEEEWRFLADEILKRGAPFSIRPLHNSIPLRDERLKQVNRAKWHGFSLEPSLDELWKQIHSSARRAIQKAQRDGVCVRVAESQADLRAFYELHLRVRKKKYRMLAQPYRFFEELWRNFIQKGESALLLAVDGDQVIAGTFFLQWQQTFYYKFNASTTDGLTLRPNDFLIWRGIEYARARGLSYFDFGLSDWDQEGLVRYKRKFATDEKEIAFLRGGEQRSNPGAEALQKLLPQITDLFTQEDVPDAVTEQAGALLYKFFT
jgi:CelD/BcsL family acetyltransferase involved in cellulose biosynthesis